jgi:hypothetical protein
VWFPHKSSIGENDDDDAETNIITTAESSKEKEGQQQQQHGVNGFGNLAFAVQLRKVRLVNQQEQEQRRLETWNELLGFSPQTSSSSSSSTDD